MEEAPEGGELLMSTETLSCDSPVIWPDQNFFGDFDSVYLVSGPPRWLKQSLKVDERTIHGYASLSPAQIMERVKALQNLAYKLGVEEAREMTRGKCLNVFRPNHHSPSDSTIHHLAKKKRSK